NANPGTAPVAPRTRRASATRCLGPRLTARRRPARSQPFPRDFKHLAKVNSLSVRARADRPARPFCLTIGRLSILAARMAPMAAGSGPPPPDQRAAATGGGRTGLGRGWGLARGLRFSRRKRLCAFAARQQKDIAMHTSIGAVAERPFARRLLAATAGLAFGLAAALPAKAQETIKVG